MSIKRNKKRFIIGSLALFLFLSITIAVNAGYTNRIDTMVFDFVKEIRMFPLSIAMQIITSFGGFYLILTIAILLFVFMKKKDFSVFLISVTGATALLNIFLKRLIDRPRPIEILPLVTETSLSYPSGHTVSSVVFYGLLYQYVKNNVRNKGLATLLKTVLIILPVLVGISRIYLGVHHLSDVLAGFCLGIAIIMTILILIEYIYVPTKTVVRDENKEYNM